MLSTEDTLYLCIYLQFLSMFNVRSASHNIILRTFHKKLYCLRKEVVKGRTHDSRGEFVQHVEILGRPEVWSKVQYTFAQNVNFRTDVYLILKSTKPKTESASLLLLRFLAITLASQIHLSGQKHHTHTTPQEKQI